MLKLVIGNKNYSTWSLRPWILLKHFEVDFTEEKVALFTDSADITLAKYDSNLKVPILQDGDVVLWDSLSILEYASENYLNNAGYPADTNARALARTVSCEMHSSFFGVRHELPMNCRKKFDNITLSQEAQEDVLRIQHLWSECRTKYAHDGKWLFGKFSIADAMFAPIALRFDGYNIPLSDESKEYVQNILNHPYIVEWVNAGTLETEIIEEDEI